MSEPSLSDCALLHRIIATACMKYCPELETVEADAYASSQIRVWSKDVKKLLKRGMDRDAEIAQLREQLEAQQRTIIDYRNFVDESIQRAQMLKLLAGREKPTFDIGDYATPCLASDMLGRLSHE